MQAFWILIPIVCLVALVGYVWLAKVAFSRSGLWGVVVLLLSPIGAIVFAVKYWHEARKPFLIYAGSVAASCVLALASMLVIGGAAMEAIDEEMARVESELEAPATAEVAEFAIEPTPNVAKSYDLAQAAAEAKREEDDNSLAGTLATLTQPQSDPTPVRRRNQFVAAEDIDGFEGKKFEIVTQDEQTFDGYYIQTRDGKLEFRRTVYSGDMTLHVSPSEIRRLRLVELPRR